MIDVTYPMFVRKALEDLSKSEKIRLYNTVDFICPDKEYAIVKKEWLLGKFYDWHKTILKDIGCEVWDDKFDCDKFSTTFRIFAHLAFKLTNPNTTAQSALVGEIYYKINADPNRGHAINFAMDKDRQIYFIEPQTGKEIKLTQEEIDSIETAIF